MRCVYQFEAICRCPADHKPDVYTVTVRTDRTIPVEQIIAAAKALSETEMFQEQFTVELHRALAAQVETFGIHSGVKTTITCG